MIDRIFGAYSHPDHKNDDSDLIDQVLTDEFFDVCPDMRAFCCFGG